MILVLLNSLNAAVHTKRHPRLGAVNWFVVCLSCQHQRQSIMRPGYLTNLKPVSLCPIPAPTCGNKHSFNAGLKPCQAAHSTLRSSVAVCKARPSCAMVSTVLLQNFESYRLQRPCVSVIFRMPECALICSAGDADHWQRSAWQHIRGQSTSSQDCHCSLASDY